MTLRDSLLAKARSLKKFNPVKCKDKCCNCRSRVGEARDRKAKSAKAKRWETVELLRSGRLEAAHGLCAVLITEQRALRAFDIVAAYLKKLDAAVSEIEAGGTSPPPDLLEAVSSLVYAANQMHEFKELLKIHEYVERKYGPQFVQEAGSYLTYRKWRVDEELVKCLSYQPPSSEYTLLALTKLAKENGIEFDQQDPRLGAAMLQAVQSTSHDHGGSPYSTLSYLSPPHSPTARAAASLPPAASAPPLPPFAPSDNLHPHGQNNPQASIPARASSAAAAEGCNPRVVGLGILVADGYPVLSVQTRPPERSGSKQQQQAGASTSEANTPWSVASQPSLPTPFAPQTPNPPQPFEPGTPSTMSGPPSGYHPLEQQYSNNSSSAAERLARQPRRSEPAGNGGEADGHGGIMSSSGHPPTGRQRSRSRCRGEQRGRIHSAPDESSSAAAAASALLPDGGPSASDMVLIEKLQRKAEKLRQQEEKVRQKQGKIQERLSLLKEAPSSGQAGSIPLASILQQTGPGSEGSVAPAWAAGQASIHMPSIPGSPPSRTASVEDGWQLVAFGDGAGTPPRDQPAPPRPPPPAAAPLRQTASLDAGHIMPMPRPQVSPFAASSPVVTPRRAGTSDSGTTAGNAAKTGAATAMDSSGEAADYTALGSGGARDAPKDAKPGEKKLPHAFSEALKMASPFAAGVGPAFFSGDSPTRAAGQTATLADGPPRAVVTPQEQGLEEAATLPSSIGTASCAPSRDSDPDDDWEIPAEELQLGQRVGIGSFGEVFRGRWRHTDVAVKRLLEQDLSPQLIEEFRDEVAIMRRLKHPNVVLFMGACTQPPNLAIVTQYVPRGLNLFRLLHRTPAGLPQLDVRRRLRMAMDIARGMNYLHACRPPIVHRDLKSPNLLVDRDFTIKVCDFGMSRVRRSAYMSGKSQAGTAEWTAPEMLRNERYTESVDIYSYGVILWELVTNREPWADVHPVQVISAVAHGNAQLPIPPELDSELADLLLSCWARPEQRPSFEQIIEHLNEISKRPVTLALPAEPAVPPLGPPTPGLSLESDLAVRTAPEVAGPSGAAGSDGIAAGSGSAPPAVASGGNLADAGAPAVAGTPPAVASDGDLADAGHPAAAGLEVDGAPQGEPEGGSPASEPHPARAQSDPLTGLGTAGAAGLPQYVGAGEVPEAAVHGSLAEPAGMAHVPPSETAEGEGSSGQPQAAGHGVSSSLVHGVDTDGAAATPHLHAQDRPLCESVVAGQQDGECAEAAAGISPAWGGEPKVLGSALLAVVARPTSLLGVD